MKTEFIPITPEVAITFIQSYEAHRQTSPPSSSSSSSEHQQALLAKIEKQIDDAIESISRENKNGGFVRCSTRSPKDSICSREKCKKVLLEELKKEGEVDASNDPDRNNRKMIALLRASLAGLHVQSGKEALNLLLTSARIHVCPLFRTSLFLPSPPPPFLFPVSFSAPSFLPSSRLLSFSPPLSPSPFLSVSFSTPSFLPSSHLLSSPVGGLDESKRWRGLIGRFLFMLRR